MSNFKCQISNVKFQIIFAAFLLLVSCFMLHASTVRASDIDSVIGTFTPPPAISSIPGSTGEEKIGSVLSNIIRLIYMVSTIVFVFMIILGAFNWIVSGGDKEKLASARKRIVHAIIGLVLLALSFVIITLVGIVTGFTLYEGQPVTSLDEVKKSRQNAAPGPQDPPIFTIQNLIPGRQDPVVKP